MKINRLILVSVLFFSAINVHAQSVGWYHAMLNQSAKLLLDKVSNQTAASNAYSLRKLSIRYNGACLRIQRSSDNQQQDIGFTGNVLDTVSLKTFVGNGTGSVAVWYDQSTKGRDLIQSDMNYMPVLITPAGINKQYGKPYLDFSNGAYFQTNGSAAYLNVSSYTINAVSTKQSGGAGYLLSTRSTASSKGLNFGWNSDNGFSLSHVEDDASFNTDYVSGVPEIFTGIKLSSGGSNLYKYGVLTSSSMYPANQLNTDSVLLVGTDNQMSSPFLGYIQELVMYPDGLNNDRRALIETNQFNYYGIPVPGTPSSLTASTGNTIGQVVLNWQAPASDNNHLITDYSIEYSISGTGNWVKFAHNPSIATNTTVTALDIYVQYDFRVSAVSSVGTGIASNIATAYSPNTYQITGSTYGLQNNQSGIISVTPVKPFTGTITLTPSGCGVTNPVQFSFNNSAVAQTFTFTPTSAGTVTITGSHSGPLTADPTQFYFTSSSFTNAVQDKLTEAPAVVYSIRQTKSSFLAAPIKVYYSGDQSEGLVTFDSTGFINGTSVVTITNKGTSNYNLYQTIFFSDYINHINIENVISVKTWYDQSGNGRDAVQNLSDYMPNISLTNNIINLQSLNKRAALSYYYSWLQTTQAADFLNGTGYTLNTIADETDLINSAYFLGTNTNTIINSQTLTFGFETSNSVSVNQGTSAAKYSFPNITGKPYLITGIKKSVNKYATLYNGIDTAAITSNNLPSGNLNTNSVLNIGTGYKTDFVASGIINSNYRGNIQEIFIFPTAISNTTRTTLLNDQYATYINITAPGTPTSLTATAGAQTDQINLSWTAPASNGGNPITDYRIEYKASTSANWISFAHTASAVASITVNGLSSGTSYDFRVSAINAKGTGTASTTATAITNNPAFQVAGATYVLANNFAVASFTVTPLFAYSGVITLTPSGAGLSTPVDLTFNNSATAQTVSFTPTTSGTITISGTNSGGLTNPVTTYSSFNSQSQSALDQISNAPAVVYSLRQMRNAYVQSAVKVVNVSNNAEAVISFDSSGMVSPRSVATITAAGNSGYLSGQTLLFSDFYANATVKVQTWYDQSGNGRDASQTVSGSQPVLVNAGVLVRDGQNQLPVLDFANAYLQTSAPATYLNGAYTLNAVSTPKTASNAAYLLGTHPNNNDEGLHFGWRSASQFTIAQFGDDANFSTNLISDIPAQFTGIKNNGGGSALYKNNSLVSGNTSPTANLNTSAVLNIGAGYLTNLNFSGYIQEMVLYSAALNSTDRSQLDANQYATYISQLPGAPAGFTATPGNIQGKINLAWSAPASNGNAVITDYKIEYSTSGSGSWNIYNDSVTANTTATVLLPDGNYDFRVSAINIIGTGNPSATASSGTPVHYSVSGPTYGKLNQGSAPVFTITPPSGYNGIITVLASGAGLSSSANLNFASSSVAQSISFTPTATGTLTLNFSNNANGVLNAPAYYYTVANPAITILDTVSISAAAAYSLRQLRSSYVNGAVKVINTATNEEAIVTFDSTGMISGRSVATISAVGTGSYFIGQTKLFADFYANATLKMKTWYDQSGNGRDGTQTNSGNQPVLVNAGVLVRDGQNQLPALDFANAYLQTAAPATYLNGPYTLNTISTPKLNSNTAYLLGTFPNGNDEGLHFGWRNATQFTIAQFGDDANFSVNFVSNIATLFTGIKNNGGGSALYKNGSLVSSNTSPTANLHTSSVLNIGTGYANNIIFSGYIQEMVLYSAALNSTDRNKLETNQYAAFIPQLAGAPTALSATGGLPGQLTLNWTAPAANGNAVITDYLIEYSVNGSGSWSTYQHSASAAASILMNGLNAGTAYLFRVSAINAIGTGPASAAYSFALASSYTITGPSYGMINTGSGNFTVTPSIPITGSITITPAGGGLSVPVQLTFNNSSTAQTFAFTPTVAETISLTMSNNAGLANPGTSYYTVADLTPQIADSVSVNPSVAYSIRQVKSNFTSAPVKVINASNNAEATVTFDSTGQIGSRSVATITAIGSSNYIAGQSVLFADFYANATVRVKTWYDQSGNNRDALAVNGVTLPALVTSGNLVKDPQNMRTALDFNSAYLQTAAAAGFLNNSGYSLNAVITSGLNNSEAYILGTTANSNDQGLHFGWRNSSTFTLAQHGDDANFTANFVSNIAAVFTGIKTGGSGSSLYKNGTLIGSNASPVANLNAVTPLNIGVGYNVAKIFNGYIQELMLFSSALNVTDRGKMEANQYDYFVPQLPSAPTGLSATGGVSGQISLSWTAPAKSGNSPISDYLIEYSVNGSGVWSTFAHSASASTSAVVTGLSSGTTYLFRVSAVNAIGNGTACSSMSALVN